MRESKFIAEGLLSQIAQNQRDVEILRDGLPDPKHHGEPVLFMGVKFYPDAAADCWRMYPAPKRSS